MGKHGINMPVRPAPGKQRQEDGCGLYRELWASRELVKGRGLLQRTCAGTCRPYHSPYHNSQNEELNFHPTNWDAVKNSRACHPLTSAERASVNQQRFPISKT